MSDVDTVDRRDDWPDAALVGLAPLRMAVIPSPDDIDIPEDRWWTVGVTVDGENEHLIVTGDVARVIGGWLIAVTAAARINFGSGLPTMASDEDFDAVVRRYGSWVAHPLWDYCRSLVVGSAGSFLADPVEIPRVTPEPLYVTSAMRRQARDDRGGTNTPEGPADS